MINPGELNKRLSIYHSVENGIDKNGFSVQQYEKLISLRCKKKTQSTKDYRAADRQSSKAELSFIVRNPRNHDIDTMMIINFNNKYYNIVNIAEYENEEYLELLTEEYGGVPNGLGI